MTIKTRDLLLKIPIIISIILFLLHFGLVADNKGGISFIIHLLLGLLVGLGIRHTITYYMRRLKYRLFRPVHLVLPLIFFLAMYFGDGLSERLLLFVIFMSITGFASLFSSNENEEQSKLNAKGDPVIIQFQAFERYLPQIAKRCQRLSLNEDWQQALSYYQKTSPDLHNFKKRAKELVLAGQVSDTQYERIIAVAEEAEEELKQLFKQVKEQPVWQEHLAVGYTRANFQRDVQDLAPEIHQVYRRILADNDAIMKLIETAAPESKKELVALQEARMRQCDDVVKGYLQIKSKPKRHPKASAKLKKAQEALAQLDEELDDILRQLNETTMLDFEVSLRLLSGRQDK